MRNSIRVMLQGLPVLPDFSCLRYDEETSLILHGVTPVIFL